MMSKDDLIIVSHSLPFKLKENDNKLEAHPVPRWHLASCIPLLGDQNVTWVGWPGLGVDPQQAAEFETFSTDSESAPISISMVQLSSEDASDFYTGMCHTSLWPLFHTMTARAEFHQPYWLAYRRVNECYANSAVAALQKTSGKTEPIVWIHDYQLSLVPNMVREYVQQKSIACKIAFFMHIPFPSYDVFRLNPWDDEVLMGLLGCDVIGFQILEHAENFLVCCHKTLGYRVDLSRFLIECDNNRSVRVIALPFGVPFHDLEGPSMSTKETSKPKSEGQPYFISVDQLDYTMGLLQRLKGYECLLETFGELQENVQYLQIVIPSRQQHQEYQVLKEDLDREIARINGRFSTTKWSPIRYIYRAMDNKELSVFYRDAAVAVVTPINDGMNLTAKEFVACQVSDPGVLVLSPFAGAASTMPEALLVNPLESHNLANVLHRALQMPEDEREMRMSALRLRERLHSLDAWLKGFLRLVRHRPPDGEITFEPLNPRQFDRWLAPKFSDRRQLVLLLDYDGTLTPIVPHPDLAVLPDETRQVLEKLVKFPDVHIAVVSGRQLENVKKMVNIEGIIYAGNHGLDILHDDGSKFEHPEQEKYKPVIEDLLQKMTSLEQDGAWIERKGSIFTFHYRNVPAEKQQSLAMQAANMIRKSGLKVMESKMAVEARPPIKWDKGRASLYLLRHLFGTDWSDKVGVIFVGDDTTDEDAIRALKGMATTFRITSGATVKTAATYRLFGTGSVQMLLEWVEMHMNERIFT